MLKCVQSKKLLPKNCSKQSQTGVLSMPASSKSTDCSVELFMQEEGQKAGKMKKKATVLNLVTGVKQTRQEQMH